MKKIFAPKLQKNDTVRVITPARSLSMPWINNQEMKDIAEERFAELGLNLTFSEHVYEIDDFDSSSIQSRIEDLHNAFEDNSVKLIITVIGGFNSNQLLKYIDYNLISQNPKTLCGYSDITALANAIYAKTGLVTYSGPHYFTFGDKKGLDYTLEYFRKALFSSGSFVIEPSMKWSNDRWVGKQDNRNFIDNDGYWIINEGQAEGTIIGGNQCTLNLLQGTEYMPSLSNSVLFLEDDYEAHPATFDRDLQSLIHQPDFDKVNGIVIGRFQPESKMTKELLTQIITTKKELNSLPVIGNVDFGHTTPQITFPIGGTVEVKADSKKVSLRIIKH
ncbi:MAG: LD-carboxypeptidase [Candidatus Pacebacteria bacterium]|nr:LD-carboxypeptidase [Candidatus Paceibacterota bacterium]